MECYTIEHLSKQWKDADEHVTIRILPGGSVEVLTQRQLEGARLLRRWDYVGRHGRLATGHRYVEFGSDCEAFRLAGAGLQEMGFVVFGLATTAGWGAVETLRSDGRVTHPDTIRGSHTKEKLEKDRVGRNRNLAREKARERFAALMEHGKRKRLGG